MMKKSLIHSTVGIWGDSIMKGVVFDSELKKYTVVKESATFLFSRRFPITIRNHSRFGCTAPRAYEQLLRFLSTQDVPDDLVLLEFGGNDCDFRWREVSDDPLGKHQSNTPIDRFECTIRDMIHAVRRSGGHPVSMSLPPIHADRYFEYITSDDRVDASRIMVFLGEKQTIYRRQEWYSSALCRIAGELNVPIVDVRSRFLEQVNLSDYLCMDGIHPNEKGQRLIHDVFSSAYYSFTGRAD